jgi:hypothetical protein
MEEEAPEDCTMKEMNERTKQNHMKSIGALIPTSKIF